MAAKPQRIACYDVTNQRNGSQSGPRTFGLSSKPSVPCSSINDVQAIDSIERKTFSDIHISDHAETTDQNTQLPLEASHPRKMTCTLCGHKGHNKCTCVKRQVEILRAALQEKQKRVAEL